MWRRLLILINIVLALVNVLAYLGGMVHPAVWWPLALASLVGPWLMLGNFVMMSYWAAQKSKLAFLSLVVLLLGFPRMGVMVAWGNDRVEASDSTLTVTTLNLQNLKGDEQPEQIEKADHEQISKTDVLFVQEASGFYRFTEDRLKPFSHYDHLIYETRGRYQQVYISSALPTTLVEYKEFKGGGNGYQVTDIDFHGQTIRLINTHLQSNLVSKLAKNLTQNGYPHKRRTWLNLGRIFKRYKTAAIERANQAEEISDLIRQSPHPVILGGDFNDIPFSYTYQLLSNTLKDTFLAGGRGLGITYSGRIPLLRIDYLLASPGLDVVQSQVITARFSDHDALRTTFVIP